VAERPRAALELPPGFRVEDDAEAGAAASLAGFARSLWSYRELLVQLTLRDVRIRYKQAVMGFAWALLLPALVVAAGTLVRIAIARVGGGEVERAHIAGMAAKALPWAFFVGALGFATNSLIGNTNLVSKVYFPRAVLPLSATLAQCFDSLVGLAALAVALPLLGVSYGATALWAPLLIALLVVFTAGVGLIVAAANLFFRDVKYLVQVGLTFGIFFTPVFFEPGMFGPRGAVWMMLNPLAPILEGLRLCLVEGHPLSQTLVAVGAGGAAVTLWSPLYLAYAAAAAAAAAVGGALLFERLQHLFAEYV
jgi:ABC-type polysaccharide/polyol phosphate export permease